MKNAFLHGTLTETVYCAQPSGFEDSAHPDFVCCLNKSLYSLKQAPRAWYQRFTTTFDSSASPPRRPTPPSVLQEGGATAYLLLYVDDIVLMASTPTLLQRVAERLHSEFAMTDLGDLHHFLGISVTRSSDGLFLSQRQYALDLLQRAGKAECHSTSAPIVHLSPTPLSTAASPVLFST